MSLPVSPLVFPSALAGLSNGRLPPEVLRDVPGGRLLAVAADAWNAMCAAARADGIELTAEETYRDLQTQMSYWFDRESLTEIPGAATSVWLGSTYWHRPGTTIAAVPGTSNHGWGLALDVLDVDRAGRLMWLVLNAHRFGFSAEIQSEAWHWRYVAGDTPPTPTTEDFEMTPQEMEQFADILTAKLAPAVARELMSYPVTTRDIDAGADTTQPLAVIEGWRNTELSMIRHGLAHG